MIGYTVHVPTIIIRSLFGELLEEKGELPGDSEGFEERKRQLLYSLNTTGHYHAYKEHIKRSVVSIVREKFLNEANTTDEAEIQVCTVVDIAYSFINILLLGLSFTSLHFPS